MRSQKHFKYFHLPNRFVAQYVVAYLALQILYIFTLRLTKFNLVIGSASCGRLDVSVILSCHCKK